MKYKDQIHPSEGAKKLLEIEPKLHSETISINEGLNRIVTKDYYALINVPSFDKSPYDGYALRGEDTIGATKDNPVEFKIIEEIPAGYFPKEKVSKMEASKILTGGSVPEGANVCIKYELTEFDNEKVRIFSEISPNSDIIKAGEDTKKGSLLVEKGTKLTPGHLGLLSSQGIDEISVYKKPTIGIFVTGSELRSPGEEIEPGQIFESNNITFKSIFENLGFNTKVYGILKDDEDLIEKQTLKAIKEVDILVTTGGASVGDYDYGLSSIKNLGGEVLFWKTAMKPGGSIVVSKLEEKVVIGLSGNPASAILGLYKVCLPFLKKSLGLKDIYPKELKLILKKDLNKKSPRVRFLRGKLEIEDGKAYFIEKSEQGNGVLSSFIDCDVLVEIPWGSEEIKAGTLVTGYRVSSIFGSIGE